MVRLHLLIVIAVTAALLFAIPPAAVAQVDNAALGAFYQKVLTYVALQRRLRTEVGDLAVTSRPEDISSASDRLALAVRRARPNGRQGDFFDLPATTYITEQVHHAVGAVDPATFIAAINDEPAVKGMPSIYMRFPAASSLATMPPSLLHVLPWLPNELEFRLVGEHLILRDRYAAMVLDYIPRALTR